MKKLILLTTVILFLGANQALAHCGKCGVGEANDSKGSMKENWAEEKVAKMTEELGLSKEQAEKVSDIMKKKIEKKKAVHEESQKKIQAIKDDYKAKLKKILTAEQLEKYEAMKAQKDEKGSRHEHKGSGHDHDHKGSEKGSAKGSKKGS